MIIRLIFIVITSLYLSGCGVGSIFGGSVPYTDYAVQNENAVTHTDSINNALAHSDISLPSTTSPSPASHDNGGWKLSTPKVSLASSASSAYEAGSDLIITATATETSFQDITVVIGTSGTATEGTDYANVSDITIPAGSTTGTTTFNPTADTNVTEGSETATLAISNIHGGGARASGITSVTITINEYSFSEATAFTEGSTSAQNAIKAETQWTNVDYSGSTSSVHPYEQMNIHKVQSFSDGTNNLTGVGQFIHIADFNCDDDHLVYANKTIHNLDDGGSGESTFSDASSSSYHCQFVASMAAGDGTGNGDGSGENIVSGVAPDADLILSSIPNTIGTYSTDDFAADLDSARGYDAVASNNSWGLNDSTDNNPNASYNVTEFQWLIDNNPSFSTNQLLAYKLEGGDWSNAAVAASQSYITALNNFQNNGVIVFASGNYNGESDVSLMAGLPEFYPQLAEAWLAVGLIDFTGSSVENASESDFTLYGNKCGSAKEYCVVADGYELNGAQYVSGNLHYYKENGSGSSYSAPMISGGIALLAQAFPNHTPEQLTDRLLASSNNDWFTAEGNTTFTTHGNSISHGYHSTWGHGLPDFYAALSPITSSLNPAMALYTGDSIQSSQVQSFEASSITPSASFGDAIYQGLIGETGYAYDALSGGFKYDMTTHINTTNHETPSINLASELSKLDSQLSNVNNPSWKNNFNQVSNLYKSENQETTLTLGASSLPVQSFFDSNSDSLDNLPDFGAPFLEAEEGGIGVSATYQLPNSRLLLGTTVPFKFNNDQIIGKRKTLAGSLEYGDPSLQSLTIMTGYTEENDNLLGLTGTDAFSLEGSSSITKFAGLKAQKQLNDDISLVGMTTIANTDLTGPRNSFINSASSVKSSGFSFTANKKNLFGDDSFALNVRQPNLVTDGNLSIRLSNLADSSGNLSYYNKNINLKPTAKQLDYTMSYRKDFEKDITISLKHIVTKNLNHEQNSKIVHASYLGAKYKDFKIGINTVPGESALESELLYALSF